MTVTDIATRTYNHGWRLDPIVRSLLDTDFYKLLMGQLIHDRYPDVPVTFGLINRTKSVALAELIDEAERIRRINASRGGRVSPDTSNSVVGKSAHPNGHE